jgi:hypothetical protein
MTEHEQYVFNHFLQEDNGKTALSAATPDYSLSALPHTLTPSTGAHLVSSEAPCMRPTPNSAARSTRGSRWSPRATMRSRRRTRQTWAIRCAKERESLSVTWIREFSIELSSFFLLYCTHRNLYISFRLYIYARLAPQGIFYTSNGLEWTPREFAPGAPTASNFYPMVAAARVQDRAHQVAFVTAHAVACGSQAVGQIELMVHRNLNQVAADVDMYSLSWFLTCLSLFLRAHSPFLAVVFETCFLFSIYPVFREEAAFLSFFRSPCMHV